jgi:hypothetical protein
MRKPSPCRVELKRVHARHDLALVARFDCQSSLPILRLFVWRLRSLAALAVGSFTETALK